MKCNVGGADRAFRIILGLAILIVVGFVFKSWWALIGLVPLLTGIVRWCPIYAPFGVSTCKAEEGSASSGQ
jgi:type IV secretory pathway TrbD component